MFDPCRFYSPREVIEEAHAPRQLVYDSLKSGELPSLRRGVRWLVPGASAAAWVEGIVHSDAGERFDRREAVPLTDHL
jgi:hypothetical protein